jgi:hypothetical protein
MLSKLVFNPETPPPFWLIFIGGAIVGLAIGAAL